MNALKPILVAFFVLMCGVAIAGKLNDGAISSSSTGSIDLERSKSMGPVKAVFVGSPILTKRLEEVLQSKGLQIAQGDEAVGVLMLEGKLRLSGGPKFQRPLQIDVGEATESTVDQTIAKIAKERSVTRGEAFAIATDLALATAAYGAPVNTFTRGLPISQLAVSIGNATGARGWFNNLVSGDPRGICLSKCDDWNKVDQTVQLRVSWKGDETQEVRVMSKAFSEELAPEEVMASAIDLAIASINVKSQAGGN